MASSRQAANLSRLLSPGVKRCWDNIAKPLRDNRLYRVIELENEMKILLISDPDTERSAACVDINMGSYCEPDELPGLAHMCEHVLFSASTKYPEPDGFMRFIRLHDGVCNGVTSPDHTMFFFYVGVDFLEDALDRLVQFFISPIFTERSIQKEARAIHWEFQKYYNKDPWKIDQLDKHMAKPGHPFGRFSGGNIESLITLPEEKGICLLDEVKKFHEKWYSSNIMTAAILGKEDLDLLQRIVVPIFAPIPNKNAERIECTDHPFGPEQFKVISYVAPTKNIKILTISFPAPDIKEYYLSKPLRYVFYLIGHEGPKSLCAVLKKREWCYRLDTNGGNSGRGFGFIKVDIDLTDKGLDNVYEIVKLFFQYINMMNSVGLQKWVLDEHEIINQAGFNFREKERPSAYVTSMAGNLHYYPPEQVVQGLSAPIQWDPDAIREILDLILPRNVRIAVVGNKFEDMVDQTEPWYGAKYKLEKIPDEKIEEWENCGLSPEFSPPTPNELMPESFEVYPVEQSVPHPLIVHESPLTRVWYMQDDLFLLPRANVKMEFLFPIAYMDPVCCNLTHIYCRALKDAFIDTSYTAHMAGMDWDIKNNEYGLLLSMDGFNDKQAILIDKILEKMINLKISPMRFEILKEKYIETMLDFDEQTPSDMTVYYVSTIVSDYAWSVEELLRTVEDLTVEHLEEFMPQMFSKIFIECFIHGNVTREKALDIAYIFESRLQTLPPIIPVTPMLQLRRREVLMSDGESYMYEVPNLVNQLSCTELYFQCGIQSVENNALLELLVQIMTGPTLAVLRHEEQLGNAVYIGIRRSSSAQGLRVVLQSPKHPLYMGQRAEAFLVRVREILANMDMWEFRLQKETLLSNLLEKPRKLSVISSAYWKEITLQHYNFNRLKDEVAFYKALKKEKLMEFFDAYIKHGGSKRCTVAIHILSLAEGGAGRLPPPDLETLNSSFDDASMEPPPFKQPEKLEDIVNFKRVHGLYPLVKPHVDINVFRPKD